MSWLTDKLQQIMGTPKPEPEFPYGETQALIGDAVAQWLPESEIRDGSVFDINVLISGQENLTELHLKMRITHGNVQMMEFPRRDQSNKGIHTKRNS